LDIDAGVGYNTLVFGQNANEILAIDLKFPKENVLKDHEIAQMILADAQFLPFKKELFDSVSFFSVIEYVIDQSHACMQ